MKSKLNKGTVLSLLAVVVLLILGLTVGLGVTSGKSTPASAAVPVGTSAHPLAGNVGNTNPVLGEVKSWPDLVAAAKTNTAYQSCLVDRIGVSWAQAQEYANLVNQGHDLRGILVSDSSVSDAQARQLLTQQGIPNVESLPIVRTSGIDNTEGLPTNGCQPFNDQRSQVRLILTVPKDVTDLSKGVYSDRGVLGLCGNPWKTLPPAPQKPVVKPSTPCGCTSTSTKPSCTSGCQPTQPCGCNHSTPPPCTYGCSTPPPCNCTTKNQVQIPVQEPGEPTVANPNAPSSAPATHPAGPGAGQAPPSSPSSNGYNPTGGSAPGGGSSNGGSTQVNQPKPNPTPSQAVPTTDPPFTGDPGQPG